MRKQPAIHRDHALVADTALDRQHRAVGDRGKRLKVVGLLRVRLVGHAAGRGVLSFRNSISRACRPTSRSSAAIRAS